MSYLVSEETKQLAKSKDGKKQETQFVLLRFIKQFSQEFDWKFLADLDRDGNQSQSAKKATSVPSRNDIVVEINDINTVPWPEVNNPWAHLPLYSWYRNFSYGIEQHGSLEITVELAYYAREALHRQRIVREKSDYRGHVSRDSHELGVGAPYRRNEQDLILVKEDRLAGASEKGNVLPALKHIAGSSQNPYLESLYKKAKEGEKIPSIPFLNYMGVPCIKITQLSELFDKFEVELMEYLGE